MAILTIHRGSHIRKLTFDAPCPLSSLLHTAEVALAQPCGGHGVCGKCAVVLSGDVSSPTSAEVQLGLRLSCQTVINGDAEVILPTAQPIEQIVGGSANNLLPSSPMPGKYGAAIDIGTTTIALLLYSLIDGHCLGTACMLNPQTSVAADVIGRIAAAMNGQADQLKSQIEGALSTLLSCACAQANIDVRDVQSLTVTGNTTMLYLLCKLPPTALSHAPFVADHLFACTKKLLNKDTYLPQCLHSFVGADTSCAILASGMLEKYCSALLCDVGTNGEIALWHDGVLYIASTAAGPAFEGAGISCGCASISGAIDSAAVRDGEIVYSTIGHQKAVGICGSGLIDTVAALLSTGILDETGYLEDAPFQLCDGTFLTQNDIRAVQLAKAAIHAGIISVLDAARCKLDDIETMYLAGGFGRHLNLSSAAQIGLFPTELISRVKVIGNAALDGAAELLLNTRQRKTLEHLLGKTQHVRLDGNAVFAENYITSMLFGDE